MIKKRVFALTFVFLMLLSSSVLAWTNPYGDLGYHDCTWTACQIAYEKLGVTLPRWGYADDWYDFAKRDGYPVGQVAEPGSIVCWKGHVGYVYSVSGNEMLVLEGGQYNESGYQENMHTCNGPSGSGKAFIGYIYLADLPKESVSETEADPEKPTEEPKNQNTPELQTETDDKTQHNAKIETEERIVQKKNSQKVESSVPVKQSLADDSEEAQKARQAKLTEFRAMKVALQNEISETELKIQQLYQDLDDQKDNINSTVRSLYIYGTESYLGILFESESVADFFTRFTQIAKVIDAKNATLNITKRTLSDLSKKQKELNEKVKSLDELML